MYRLSTAMRLIGWVAVLSMMMMASGTVEGRRVTDGEPRDLFDQVVQSLASKYLPGYQAAAGEPGARVQWSVHPLPRKRQLNLSPSSSSSEDDAPSGSALAGLLGGISGGEGGGGGGGNAIPASVLAAAANPAATASAGGAGQASAALPTAVSASSADRSASASASASNASPPPPASSPSAAPSSTPLLPLSKLITSTPLPSSSPSNTVSSSSSTTSTLPTTTSTTTPSPSHALSLLSPKHKMFPLVVAGLAAAGLLALMLLIAIARCIAHDQLRRDNLRKSYAFDASPSKRCEDRFTSAAGLGAARSVRRTHDSSVLIEVGDEVFAVPAHLADSYRESVLREKRSRSDLTAVEDGGLFGSVKPKHLSDGGPDGDEEQARAAYDSMLAGAGVGRSLSQRLGDKLRALTASAPVVEEERGQRGAYSFHSAHQQAGAMRQADLGVRLPVVTTGAAGWAITQRQTSLGAPAPAQPKTPSTQACGTAQVLQRTSLPHPAPLKQPRKPAPKLELSLLTEKLADLEKQSQPSSRKLPAEARLTRPPTGTSAAGTFGGSLTSDPSELSVPGAFPERTKSLHRNKSRPLLDAEGSFRHRPAARAKTHVQPRLERKQSSVALASPTRWAHERQANVVVHPERPQPAATLRPLPVPPPFTSK
ncbi:uncharacterized protein SRS1_12163 [Sporisorium reilianum f. sp. reilianum]|uniref:Uncharacterized protein n=1 Tax=Sporisorium reilianum f. sp. reilianum TaxID=72559 RepID=A0A2N8U793_9BASI|nr:uncharacterized protein SRS1_12163 [Sporisorium reilianum f. sp. reilianum]